MTQYWSVGFNEYWRSASIFMSECPWWVDLIDNITTFICDRIPEIPLPDWKFHLSDETDWSLTDNKDGWTTYYEWYGSLRDLVHIKIHIPIETWVNSKTTFQSFQIPYDIAKDQFKKEYQKYSWDRIDIMDFDEDDIAFEKKAREISEEYTRAVNKYHSRYRNELQAFRFKDKDKDDIHGGDFYEKEIAD